MLLCLSGGLDCYEARWWLRACRDQTVGKDSVNMCAYPQRQALVHKADAHFIMVQAESKGP